MKMSEAIKQIRLELGLPWMKDGYRIPWAQLYARIAFMTKGSSEMKLIKFRFLANIF